MKRESEEGIRVLLRAIQVGVDRSARSVAVAVSAAGPFPLSLSPQLRRDWLMAGFKDVEAIRASKRGWSSSAAHYHFAEHCD